VIRRIWKLVTDVLSLRHAKREIVGLRGQIAAIEQRLSASAVGLAEAEYKRLTLEVSRKDSRRLEAFGEKVLSQNDEDGIIREIFSRIGTRTKTFLEFGTGDGAENNTVRLLLDGWSGVWIDGCADSHRRQRECFSRWINFGVLKCVQAFLDVQNICSIVASAGMHGEIDLLSVDVDGNDLELWRALTIIRPRVLVIEYNAYLPPPVAWCMPYDPSHCWDGKSAVFGASLQAWADAAGERGYVLVGCNVSGLNAFFVLQEEAGSLFAGSGCPVELYQPRRWWLDCLFRRPSPEILSKAAGGVIC
jgi:hypothetical protein